MDNFSSAVQALKQGRVIAYPTEGVFGVGCDPDNIEAIEKLLKIKQRPIEKGLILIAANYEQLLPYIDESQLTSDQLAKIKASWPGAVTWVMPVQSHLSNHLTGAFSSIAVRVTDHPLVQTLCLAFDGAITSTSANLSGQLPCRTTEQVVQQLGDLDVTILTGETSGRLLPSEIRDAKTDQIIRVG